MKTKLKLLSATTAAAIAVVCAAGVTLALDTAENSSSGSVSTAKLILNAAARNVEVYSAVSATDAGEFTDEHGNAYRYEKATIKSGENTIDFSRHSGYVRFDDESVAINGMMPGDKVEFDIGVTSGSNVSFHYRAELYVDKTQGQTLLNELDFSAGELGLRRADLNETVSDENFVPAVLTDYTPWTTYGGSQVSIEQIHVCVSFPITATKGQGENVTFRYNARGEQNLDELHDVAAVGEGEERETFSSLAEAVDYAQKRSIKEVSVINCTNLKEGARNEEGTVIVSSALSIKGIADEKGVYPTLHGARISVTNGAAAEISNLNFSGTSYLDLSNCSAFTLGGCKANVEAVRFFDEYTRSYLPDAAFLVAGSSLTPTALTLTDNTIVAQKGAAICMRTQLKDGSLLARNAFGTAEAPCGGSAAVALGGAQSNAAVRVTENEFCGKLGVSLGSAGGTRWLLLSEKNKAFGATAFVGGEASAFFLDNGSAFNGNALVCADLACENLLGGGVNVTLDSFNAITSGNVVVSDNLTMNDFYVYFVTKATLSRNAIVLYRDGAPYAYFNGNAESAEGYVIDPIV